jgi:3-dehydroquinate synthase
MTTLEIRTATGLSRIHIGEALGTLGRYTSGRRTVVITDVNVDALYGASFAADGKIVLPAGEETKTLATIERIYGRLLEMGADRSTFIAAVGGGVVCDIAGFAASTYMRGLPFGFAATTLVAQVDAAVGGKNGVNFGGYKNMVGVFQQPLFVICDPDVLRTLPRREVACGLAELVKTAVVGSPGLFEDLELNAARALALEQEFIARAVHGSLLVKASIVEADEKEAGERRRLNFGHTLGHAVESATGLSHGEAVSVGMAFAAELSVRKGFLGRDECGRVTRLLKRLGLPLTADAPPEAVLDAVAKDKKKDGGSVRFVFLEGIGRTLIREISFIELESAVRDLR